MTAMMFLEEYRRYYREVCDGPERFATASAYVAAGLILANRIRLRWAAQELRPNLWCVFMGPSTVTRKTTSVNIAAHVATFAGVQFTLDVTREAAMRKMSGGRLDILAREWGAMFASFQAEFNQGLLERLTEAYDGDPVGGERVTMKGSEEIKNPIVTITGASTEDWVGRALHKRADIGAGFMARFVMVYAPERDRPEARPGSIDRQRALWLHHLSRRYSGDMSMTDGAYRVLESELAPEVEKCQRDLAFFPRLCDRAREHAVKLAMIHAALEYSGAIHPRHMEPAVKFVLGNLDHLRLLERKLAASPFLQRAEQLHRVLLAEKQRGMSYRELLNRFAPKAPREVAELVAFLRDAGKIAEETRYDYHCRAGSNGELSGTKTPVVYYRAV